MRLLFFCLKRPFRRWPRLSTFFHRSWISTGPPLLRRTPTQQILRDDSWARRWQSSHAGFSKSSILKVSCISACHIGIMGIAVLSARPSALQQRLPDNFLNLKNDVEASTYSKQLHHGQVGLAQEKIMTATLPIVTIIMTTLLHQEVCSLLT